MRYDNFLDALVQASNIDKVVITDTQNDMQLFNVSELIDLASDPEFGAGYWFDVYTNAFGVGPFLIKTDMPTRNFREKIL